MDEELESLLGSIKEYSIEHTRSIPGIGSGGVLLGTLICKIHPDRNPDEWEEIKTILHELLHSHSKFEETVGFIDPIGEQAIDDEADKILRESPEVVSFLLLKLREAKFRQIKESIIGPIWRKNIDWIITPKDCLF